jgi:pimeloyl-ACP methyl ester carboxylesterase
MDRRSVQNGAWSANRRRLVLAVAGVVCLFSCGCQFGARYDSPKRMRQGLVLVLPGIEGRSLLNRHIAAGLNDGGVKSAIEIYDWTTGIPGNVLWNLIDLERNREEAWRLARKIIRYQQRWPGRPVILVGHSGGGGVAVLAMEYLTEEHKIDLAILLAPALSSDYDLTKAMRSSRHGIMNFYSEKDVGLLKVGTTIFGPIDREFGVSAGAAGFKVPEDLSESKQTLYKRGLRQVRWQERLERFGADGTHFGWASRQFAREYLAPLVKEHEEARNDEPHGD